MVPALQESSPEQMELALGNCREASLKRKVILSQNQLKLLLSLFTLIVSCVFCEEGSRDSVSAGFRSVSRSDAWRRREMLCLGVVGSPKQSGFDSLEELIS